MKLSAPYQIYSLLTAILVLSACSGEKNEDYQSADSLSDSTRIFIVGKNNSPEWVSLKKGIEAAAADYQDILLTMLHPEKSEDLTLQLSLMSSLDSGISGLILDPVDEVALSISAGKLKDKGVPVFTINKGLEKPAHSHWSTPLDSLGILPALEMGKLLKGAGTVLILNHPESGENYTRIAVGFKKVLADRFPEISILSDESYQEPNSQSAYSLSETMLIMYPQVKGVFCTHHTGTGGMLKALRDIDKSTEVILIGTGFSEIFEISLGEGEIHAIYVEDTFLLGIQIFENLMKAINKTGYPEHNFSPIRVITRENIHTDSTQSFIQSLNVTLD